MVYNDLSSDLLYPPLNDYFGLKEKRLSGKNDSCWSYRFVLNPPFLCKLLSSLDGYVVPDFSGSTVFSSLCLSTRTVNCVEKMIFENG